MTNIEKKYFMIPTPLSTIFRIYTLGDVPLTRILYLQFRSKRRKRLTPFPRTVYSQLNSIDEDFTTTGLSSNTALRVKLNGIDSTHEEPT